MFCYRWNEGSSGIHGRKAGVVGCGIEDFCGHRSTCLPSDLLVCLNGGTSSAAWKQIIRDLVCFRTNLALIWAAWYPMRKRLPPASTDSGGVQCREVERSIAYTVSLLHSEGGMDSIACRLALASPGTSNDTPSVPLNDCSGIGHHDVQVVLH